ncbi:MAG: acyltransferase family protein [Sphingomicrobium sp.]
MVEARPSARFVVLDSWRGLCALWVAAYHFRVIGHITDSQFVRAGDTAVDFFFVLSGFVLWHGFGGKLVDKTARVSFIIRRFGRLYPLHLAMLGFVVLLELGRWSASMAVGHPIGSPAFTGDYSLWKLPANVLLLHGLGLIERFSWNVPSWSISVEFTLCFFFLLVAAFRRPMLAAGVAAAIGTGAVLFIDNYLHHPFETSSALAQGASGFFLGILVHGLYQRTRHWRPNGFLEATAVAAIIGSAYLTRPFLTLAFAYAVYIFAFQSGAISRILKWRRFVRHGDLSYSIYLIHYPMVLISFAAASLLGFAVKRGHAPFIDTGSVWTGDILMFLFLASVVAVSSLTYRWIEEPWRLHFNRVASAWRRKVDEVDKPAAQASGVDARVARP